MRKIVLLLVVTVSLLMSGCSSKQISTYPTNNLKVVNNNVIVNVTGKNVASNIVDLLTREIKGQLIIAGFDMATTNEGMNLDVVVTCFKPGNAFTRIMIGFGAGRGSLLYIAEYTDQEGNILAKMDGQERFTGGEIGFNSHYGGATTLGGEKTVTKVLIKEAAKHIVELTDAQPQSGNQN